MSDTNNEQTSQSSDNDANQIPEQSKLETLKARADLMGIKYHHKAGVDKLRKLVNDVINTGPDTIEDTEENTGPAPITEFLTAAEFASLNLRKRRRNAGSLVRVRVVCMNPGKKDWEGEIFSVGSAKLGTFKKYVPFNSEDGYHVPQIMLDMIKERKCAIFQTVKGPKGNKIRKAKLVPEFSVEVLTPLSKEELKDLAQQQAMSGAFQE